jgi:hypothetical protein
MSVQLEVIMGLLVEAALIGFRNRLGVQNAASCPVISGVGVLFVAALVLSYKPIFYKGAQIE